MVLCPVAIAVGCRKCPIFAVCPAKSLIGDQAPASERSDDSKASGKSKSGKGKSSR